MYPEGTESPIFVIGEKAHQWGEEEEKHCTETQWSGLWEHDVVHVSGTLATSASEQDTQLQN